MNYYKSDMRDYLDQDIPVPNQPMIMTYKEVSDKAHDSLLRCQVCNLKFDIHRLFNFGTGRIVCRYCMVMVNHV